MNKTILICASLLLAMLSQIVLSTNPLDYDPLMDINDDGRIDIVDISNLAIRYGAEGTPINRTLLTELEQKYAIYVFDYSLLMKEVNRRNCMSGTFESTIFVTPDDSYVQDAVYSATGMFQGNRLWSWNDIRDIYEWVHDNIAFRDDPLYPMLPSDPSGAIKYLPDMWQFPNETLRLKQGDCEDHAALLCSMIRCCQKKLYWIECIWITDNLSSHLAVQIPVVDDNLVILDPIADYYTKDSSGNLVSKKIEIEINNYLNKWQIKFKDRLYPWRIFAEYWMKEFASTDEYITWSRDNR